MKKIYSIPVILISTVFFIGYIPKGSGTVASLVSLIFILYIKPDNSYLLIIISLLFLIGTIISHFAENIFNQKDSKLIVIDEFTGYLISIVFLPVSITYLVPAFFLFRFLDILKPPPIRNVEKLIKGGLGIMLDDMLAGGVTNLILQIARMAV